MNESKSDNFVDQKQPKKENKEMEKDQKNKENIIDVQCEEVMDKKEIKEVKECSAPSHTETNLVKLEEATVLMDLYTNNEFDMFKGYSLVPKRDREYLKEHAPDYQERFVNRSFFRSDFEMRYGVLSEAEHPTVDSKYWQAIGEQAVHVQEYVSLEFEQKKSMVDMELLQAKIDELEYKLTEDFEHDFDRKKIEAKLSKKQIELQEKNYGLILQRKTAKERMKEIKNWDIIIAELKPQVKHGTDDFEKHHPERYIRRYGQRLQNLNLLGEGDKEHVVKHFSSFAQAPENKEIAQKYVDNYRRVNQQLPNNQVKTLPGRYEEKKSLPSPVQSKNVPLNESSPSLPLSANNQSSNLEQPKETSQIDFTSKKEMMEKDPITGKFFNRRVRKILIATPHRIKDDPNVTNFFKMQTPAAFDVMIEQPYGFTVPDARNFIVDKAIKEEFDYIFFVDDDVLIPRNALVQLIHHKTDIVGGFYYRKYFPLESCGMHIDGENRPVPIEDFKIGDVIHNTLVLPSGCTLINVDLFKKMEAPWYRTCTINNKPTITEDTYLCQRIRDLDMDIITDLGVQCIHVNKENGVLYGHENIVNQEKNQVYENYREYFAI